MTNFGGGASQRLLWMNQAASRSLVNDGAVMKVEPKQGRHRIAADQSHAWQGDVLEADVLRMGAFQTRPPREAQHQPSGPQTDEEPQVM